jgi:hypothetical protein
VPLTTQRTVNGFPTKSTDADESAVPRKPSLDGVGSRLRDLGVVLRIHARHTNAAGNLALRLYTRTGLDWTNRFPPIAADVGRLPAGKLVMDGEVIRGFIDRARPARGACLEAV